MDLGFYSFVNLVLPKCFFLGGVLLIVNACVLCCFLDLCVLLELVLNSCHKLQARIDSHNKILYARHADQRNATFQRVLQTGSEFDRDVRSMLLRANLIKYDQNLRVSRKL